MARALTGRTEHTFAIIEYRFYTGPHALGQPATRLERLRRRAAAHRARRGGADVRRPRVPRHDLLRGARQVDRLPRSRSVPDAVSLDDQPVPGLHSCLSLLLRAEFAYVP